MIVPEQFFYRLTNSLQGFSCSLPPNRAISAGPLVSCNNLLGNSEEHKIQSVRF